MEPGMKYWRIGYGGPAIAGILLALVTVLGGNAQASPQYALDCNTCHQMPPRDSGNEKKNPFNGAVPGRHQTHATSDVVSCAKCHGDGVTAYATGHRNKVIEFRDSLGYGRKPSDPAFMNQTTVPPNPLTGCSTAACHSNGKGTHRPTPAWSSTSPATCDTCHDSAPSTNKHSRHISDYGFGCVKCHSDHAGEAKPFQHATSAGGRSIDVHFTSAPNSGGTFASSNCSNLYCHSDGRGNNKVASWTGGGLDCKGCHGDASTDTLSGKHSKHVNNSGVLGTNYGCVKCHSATVSDNTTIADVAKHVNGTKDVSAGCFSCHQDGKNTDKSVGLDWNGATTLDCKGCHGSAAVPDFASVAGEPNYANTTAGDTRANTHKKHVTSGADCVKCHSTTTADGLSIKPGAPHADGAINVVADGTLASFTADANKTCSNISCHSGNGVLSSVQPAQWGATLNCQGCHSTLSAAHTKHTGSYGCVNCHSTTVTDNTTIKPAGTHMNNAISVAGGSFTNVDLPNHTCTTSCHLSGTPNWTNLASGQCGTCHDATSPLISTNAHSVHFNTVKGPGIAGTVAGCQVCHNYSGETTHVNGTKNMNATFAATGGCSTCHTSAATNWTSAASVTCESCHTTTGGALSQIGGVTAPNKTLAATKGHGSVGQGCTACHDGSAAHISGTLGDATRLRADRASCSSCHDGGTARTMQTHVDFANTCSACHDPHGTGNSLMVKSTLNGTTVSFSGTDFVNDQGTGVCQACHNGLAYYNKGVQETNHETSNCLECHQHNTASGTAFEPNRACDSCHGYPPAPRKVLGGADFALPGDGWTNAKYENYSGGGGAHLIAAHISKDVKLTEGITPEQAWAPCMACHNGGAASHAKGLPMRNHVENVTVKVDPQYRFSDQAFIVYTSAKLVSGGANKTGSCFNVSCHIAKSPVWSLER
jgi:predicted CxxxxCH...CXXCH cytochrome family protein